MTSLINQCKPSLRASYINSPTLISRQQPLVFIPIEFAYLSVLQLLSNTFDSKILKTTAPSAYSICIRNTSESNQQCFITYSTSFSSSVWLPGLWRRLLPMGL